MIGQNDTEYDKFKTPVFEISISDAKGKNFIPLPPMLLSLVEKIEITETIVGCNVTQQMNIIIKEGSREPFNRSISTDTRALYPQADITNSSGMLADLRFTTLSSGERGFTSRVPALVGASIPTTLGTSLTPTIPGASMAQAENRIVVDDSLPEIKNPEYVFNQRNYVKVTWGYAEDPSSFRSVAAPIQMVQTEFPEQGMPSTILTCLAPQTFMSQLTPKKAVYLNLPVQKGTDDITGEPLYIYEDLDVQKAIEQIAKGFKVIVSDNILNKKLDKTHTKLIPTDKSFDQMLRSWASSSNAFFINYFSTTQNKPVIAFLSKKDFLEKELIENRQLFTWQGRNSILKSVNVKVDFSGLTGSAVSGVSTEGVFSTVSTNTGGVATVSMFERGVLDTQPIAGNAIPEAQSLNQALGNDKEVIAATEIAPNVDDLESVAESAQATAACRENLVFLEFTSLGYPKLTNGAVYFGGIGNRYSGQYTIMTLTHTIDSNGYTMRGTAEANGLLNSNGVSPKGASTTEGPKESDTVDVELFNPKQGFKKELPGAVGTSTTASNSKASEYFQDVLA